MNYVVKSCAQGQGVGATCKWRNVLKLTHQENEKDWPLNPEGPISQPLDFADKTQCWNEKWLLELKNKLLFSLNNYNHPNPNDKLTWNKNW
jgi:hypothetical protein